MILESLKLADAAEAKAAQINTQFPNATTTPQDLEFFTQQRVDLNDILTELDITQQLTVETADGNVIILTGQDLEMVDRLLASYLVGIIDQIGGNSSVQFKSTPRSQVRPLSDFETLQDAFRTTANNILNGGGAFLGSSALVVAGSALVLTGVGEVAITGGIVLAGGGALWALGSTSILNNLGGFFDE